MPLAKTYLVLVLAIAAEVVATTALSRSESFTRLGPTVVTVIGYALAFWLLSLTLKVMPTGIVYAIWSGVGIVLIAGIGWVWYGQKLDAAALVGLGLILAGVLIVNVFSTSIPH
ncbi:multidrug transporter EmrE [mine drainage metagenome]|uniref:Multidrug transporter EmrE n=1 Tax=mine drainage metagenome TaxID=410659 RepID=A0A1J5PX40_9ZZZZ